MKSLIVPTNFSESSQNAARYAVDLALSIQADIHLLHVVELPVSNGEIPLTEEIFNSMKESGDEGLAELKSILDKQSGGKINIYTLLETGSVLYQLEEFCKRIHPFAVIMGINKSSTGRFIFGSNTLSAIQHLHYPLFVIPESAAFQPIRQVILACGLSVSNSNLPVQSLKDLQSAFNASFEVVSVGNSQINETNAVNDLGSLKKILDDLHPTYHYVLANTTEEGIHTFLADHKADLLLFFPENHGFFEFHKSRTKKMALHTDLPLVTIHE